ncbi:DUF4253 domain-containing protein [Streptomyces stelliscabiei]
MPGETSYPGDHDADEVLAEFWDAYAGTEDPDWPGLTGAPAPDRFPADPTPSPPPPPTPSSRTPPPEGPPPRPGARRRSADIPAAIGWTGPVNHENDVARLCAVLRSWEDRFGIRVVALTFDQLVLSVAAPPTTEAEAEAVAAEHFAFCPTTSGRARPTAPALPTPAPSSTHPCGPSGGTDAAASPPQPRPQPPQPSRISSGVCVTKQSRRVDRSGSPA